MRGSRSSIGCYNVIRAAAALILLNAASDDNGVVCFGATNEPDGRQTPKQLSPEAPDATPAAQVHPSSQVQRDLSPSSRTDAAADAKANATTSAEDEPSGAVSIETQLRRKLESFSRMAYFTLDNIRSLLEPGRTIDAAVCAALKFRINIQRIYLSGPAPGSSSSKKAPQVAGAHSPEVTPPIPMSRRDFFDFYNELIGRPCVDLVKLYDLYEDIVVNYELRATDKPSIEMHRPGITTTAIVHMKELKEICQRIQSELSIKRLFDELRSFEND